METLRGYDGLPRLALRHPGGASAELLLHGALLTSWHAPGIGELLFMSQEAVLGTDAEVHGGIPVIFPQFGPGPLPQHGFARQHPWSVLDSGRDARGRAFARLRLTDSPATRELWPHAFAAELEVRLGARLRLCLEVTNTGGEALEFQAGLHNYFRIGEIGRARVDGLRGVRYRDKTRNDEVRTDGEAAVRFGEETDRVYLQAPDAVTVRDPAGERVLTLHKRGFADVVVWNPWIGKARELENFGEEEYRRMACVEAVQVGEPVRLPPGGRWRGAQLLAPIPSGTAPAGAVPDSDPQGR